MKRRGRPQRWGHGGFMLLEVLIAILILALGVLSVIGLQAAAIRNTAAAKYRADASFIASQRVGSMWANPEALGGFVENDTDLGTALPDGKRTTAVNGTQVTVTVTWRAPGATDRSNVVVVAYISV
ncbi:MAG: type IV pilus modification protein PilV [Betaproteobacteria bacterium]|nr:MAG: type IV pilus modification protein PilV [Betaproteobacteria bacterium]